MLFEQHLQRMEFLKATLEDLEEKELIHSKFGFHYKLCPWSDDDASSGPDTYFAKAFDRVGIHSIMDELKVWKIGPKIAKYIFNFLTNRKISVLANKVYSTSQSLDNGIPQGSPLSVILFVIAYNKLNQIIAKQKNCQFTAYADDYTIIYKLNKKTTNLNIDPLFREILVCRTAPTNSYSQKFHHLKTLLVDEAANLVRHLAITDTAYNTAWERLKERYNRPRHIVNSFLEQFKSLPTTTKIDATVLRKVSDGANEIVRGLDAVNQKGRDCWIINLALEKLDADTRRRWIERSMETDSHTVEEFFTFLDSRCEELELSKRELATGSKATTHPEKPKRITQSMVAGESSGCTKCSSTEHTLYGCQQFLDMSGLQRRSFVKEKSSWGQQVQVNIQGSGNLAQIAEGDEQNLSASNTNPVTLSHLAQGAGTQKVVQP
ncbi:uncharacterized protein [Drosophila suzukii]|uniref:Reverse transcriptase domain-containing protein n=1 Tax=Drosophila suzukii TaxID=28584 RepID=A0AB40DN92_DROSZ